MPRDTFNPLLQHQLLSPGDPCQTPGRKPRRYPVRELPVGGWFRVEGLSAANGARRAAATMERQDGGRRFTVMKESRGRDANTWICVRVK